MDYYVVVTGAGVAVGVVGAVGAGFDTSSLSSLTLLSYSHFKGNFGVIVTGIWHQCDEILFEP
jgi:hypothetical protein